MRKLITIEKSDIRGRREIIEQRLKNCQSIHSPYSWYREDVAQLLAIIDVLEMRLKELNE